MPDRARIDWRFAALATLVVTCLSTLQGLGQRGGPSFPVAHHHELLAWGVWLALTPAIILTTRWAGLTAGTPTRWLGRQLLLGTGFALVSLVLQTALRSLLRISAADVGLIPRFAGELLRYAIIAMAYQTVASYRAAHERETLAAKLRAELAEARLANLEGRLQPHFLFNTLNSIAALVREDPRAAETMVEQLSELLRASLGAHPQREVTLEEELRLVEQYLAIQQVRFQDRLRVNVTASETARRGLVPQLILQPVVENAVRHGIGPRLSGGEVTVSAAIDRDQLVMTVDDDGVGMGNAPAGGAGHGLGLGSIAARLTHLYGSAQRCEVQSRIPSGTRVVIAVPYRPVAA